MSWIPVEERLPENSCGDVWVTGRYQKHVFLVPAHTVSPEVHDAWMPMERPAHYVKPRRFVVEEGIGLRHYVVDSTISKVNENRVKAKFIPTREAAEKIAEIYEEAYRGE